MLQRISFLANYASLAQLQKALKQDVAITLGSLLIALALVAGRHPFIAIPFQLISGVEGLCVGAGLYLIRKRRTA